MSKSQLELSLPSDVSRCRGGSHTALGVLSPLGDVEDALSSTWDSLSISHHLLPLNTSLGKPS